MLTERKKPTFTPEHRSDLLRLGLIDAQVDALEAILPLCQALLQKPPTMQDVRGELLKLSNAIERAEAVVSRLENAGKNSPAKFEAWQRIIEACDDPQDVSHALSTLKAVVQRACENRPLIERRHRKASWLPVALIDKALTRGFVNPHVNERGKQRSHYQPDFALHNPPEGPVREMFLKDLVPPLPKFNIELPSSPSPNSPFCEIVGICYSAMGFRASDGEEPYPERAIRNYIERKKKMSGLSIEELFPPQKKEEE